MPIAAVIKIIEIAIAGMGVLPSVIDSISDLIELRKRLKDGGGVTDAELDAIINRVSARSARIQAA